MEPGIRRAWASVGALALGAFIIVMTETLPVGLLPQMADGLHVSLGLAGLVVLVPGFSAAVSAPLFFLGSARFNRRSIILVLGLTVLVSNAVSRPVSRAGRWWDCLPALVLPAIASDGHTHLRDLVGVVTRRAGRFGTAAGAVAL